MCVDLPVVGVVCCGCGFACVCSLVSLLFVFCCLVLSVDCVLVAVVLFCVHVYVSLVGCFAMIHLLVFGVLVSALFDLLVF